MSDRQNKVALVTGASRGMGRAAAIALASAGAHVLVHYNSNGQAADAVVAEISDRGGSAQTVSADLGTPDGPFGLSAAVRRIANGKIDIFVSNAGICRPLSLENTTAEDFDEQFAVNVRAPFFLVQQLAPMMPPGGSIVLTSSLAARTTVGELSAYAASKGAISTLERFSISLHRSRRLRNSWRTPGASRGRGCDRWRSRGRGWYVRRPCAGGPSAWKKPARSG